MPADKHHPKGRIKKPKVRQAPPANWREMEFVNTDEAAAIIRCSPANVVAKLHAGLLRAKRVDGKVIVATESLVELLDGAPDWIDAFRTGAKKGPSKPGRKPWEPRPADEDEHQAGGQEAR